MSSTIQVRLKLFGVLRKHGKDSEIHLELQSACTVSELRRIVGRHLADRAEDPSVESLLQDCAIADESKVLQPEAMIGSEPRTRILAVLPPVCGG